MLLCGTFDFTEISLDTMFYYYVDFGITLMSLMYLFFLGYFISIANYTYNSYNMFTMIT